MHKVQFILYSNENNVWKQIIHSCQTDIRALKITRYSPQPFESASKLIKQKLTWENQVNLSNKYKQFYIFAQK